MRIQSRFVAFLYVNFVLLLAAALACGEYPGVPRQLAGNSGLENPGLPPASGAEGGSSSAPGSQVVSGQAVRIELRDFELVPADLTVPAGDVTFTLVNAGRYTHDFRVEGEGLDEKSPRVAAGRTGEWAITLAPGVYHLSCPISNHADRGMVGTLTVVP